MIQRQTCAADGCGAAALPLSNPARCLAHLSSWEDWFEHFLTELDILHLTPEDREFEVLTAKSEVSCMVYRDPIASELYADWYRRAEPAGRRKFSIADVTKFMLLAAASGIAGNASYDALKRLVYRVGRPARSSTPFDHLVTPEKYEELRQRVHRGTPATIEVSPELELLVRRRYWIIVRTDDPKDGLDELSNERGS